MIMLNAGASGDKFTRTIKKEFPVHKDASLTVDNKYGKIHCASWDRDVVSFEVTISVDAANEQKAARIFDMIRVDIYGSESEVGAETEISDAFKGNNDNTSIKVDYMIRIPETVSLSLENKFGDIYIEKVKGPARIDLSYGSLEAGRLGSQDNNLDIKFSKATIDTITSFTAELKYSELTVYNSKMMNAESKFSTVRIEKVTAAEIDSQYDTYNIGDVQTAEIQSEFSTIKITKLLKRIHVDSKYGSIQVKYIAPGFDEAEIYNEFGGLELGLDEEASYQLDATISLGSLSYPKEKASLIKESEDYTTTTYRGVIGTNKSTASRIFIDSSKAGVTIKAW
jgi:hypothetical protein